METYAPDAHPVLKAGKGEAREFDFKVGKAFSRECPRITFPQHIYPFLASIHCRNRNPAIIICPNGDRYHGTLSLYRTSSQTYYQLRILKANYNFAVYLRSLPVGENLKLRVSRSAKAILVTVLREAVNKSIRENDGEEDRLARR